MPFKSTSRRWFHVICDCEEIQNSHLVSIWIRIRFWLSVWTRIKMSWLDMLGQNWQNPLKKLSAQTLGNTFARKSWKIFFGFFSPATLSIEVTQNLFSFSSALWKNRRVKGTAWGFWTQKHPLKSSQRLSSCALLGFYPLHCLVSDSQFEFLFYIFSDRLLHWFLLHLPPLIIPLQSN